MDCLPLTTKWLLIRSFRTLNKDQSPLTRHSELTSVSVPASAASSEALNTVSGAQSRLVVWDGASVTCRAATVPLCPDCDRCNGTRGRSPPQPPPPGPGMSGAVCGQSCPDIVKGFRTA